MTSTDAQDPLWSTLYNVTSIKRIELAKQRDACRVLRADLLGPLDSSNDSKIRVRLLLRDAGKRIVTDKEQVGRRRKLRASDMVRRKESAQHQEILDLAGISASNVQRFLDQSEHDASISSPYFIGIEKRFREALDALEIKYLYATLFSDLVTERSAQRLEATDYESVGRQEMQDQRAEWESLVFSALPIDQSTILSTLGSTFSSPEAVQSLDSLRSYVEVLCSRLQNMKIQASQMKLIVDGLITSDLLSEDQTSVLKEVRNSPTWLNEMADVLNLRLASIEQWQWQTDAMSLEMRRQLNGKYRVFMQEEITQALLIYHVGITFASGFGKMFDKFYESSGWKKHTGIARSDQAEWDYYIGNQRSSQEGESITSNVSKRYRSDYFMSMLPRDVTEGIGGYGDDAIGDGEKPNLVSKTVDSKHSLLHLIVAESLMADYLDEELIVLQTDFRWFGPSLSHSTIAAVMKFFGVTPVWRRFFEVFLRAPMRFLQDGPHGAIRVRERGTPMSHVLSSFFGEATLFCLDFAVNEATKGQPMFRMHDDIWMWGTTEETTAAWKALTDLSSVMGITINEEKTGVARLTQRAERAAEALPSTLPKGPLHWGLLSVQQNRIFAINQAKVDEHIAELRRQLSSRKSILEYIKAYNSYMQFFALNFAKPANALGRSHVDDCLTTLSRINREVCPSTDGGVAAYIKGMIKDKFQVDNIPDGFIYFPMVLGGLDLRNPYITFQGVREMVQEEPNDILDEAFEKEEVEYRRLEKLFVQRGPSNVDALPSKPAEFMSRGSYSKFRRENSEAFSQAWSELMSPPMDDMMVLSAEMRSLIGKIGGVGLHIREPYWRTIAELYGEEMGRMFGSLQVVEKGLLPMGMVELFKGKVRWDA